MVLPPLTSYIRYRDGFKIYFVILVKKMTKNTFFLQESVSSTPPAKGMNKVKRWMSILLPMPIIEQLDFASYLLLKNTENVLVGFVKIRFCISRRYWRDSDDVNIARLSNATD